MGSKHVKDQTFTLHHVVTVQVLLLLALEVASALLLHHQQQHGHRTRFVVVVPISRSSLLSVLVVKPTQFHSLAHP